MGTLVVIVYEYVVPTLLPQAGCTETKFLELQSICCTKYPKLIHVRTLQERHCFCIYAHTETDCS